MKIITLVLLKGIHVDLEPFHESHRDELRVIAQDESIWTYFPYSALGKNFENWFDKTLKKTKNLEQLAFAVRQKSNGKVVGTTRYYDIALKHLRLMIGHTWYTQEGRGTMINPECKFLLLQHAFEKLGINRIEIATDARNLRSRAAIKKLGATEEGILRQHMICENGYVRDTVLFSLLKEEWPHIKERLQLRLGI